MATLSSPPATASAPPAPAPNSPWTATQTRAQFGAIARLRWLIFRNNLRRKNNVGDLIAMIVMVPLFLAFTLGPAVGVGVGAGFAVSSGHFEYIAPILWAIFLLCQLTSIQLGQPGTTFDPTQLIRFPLAFRGYALIRIFFGLLSPSNTLAVTTSLGVAIGITVADTALAGPAFLALAAYALVNIFFTRMLFTWVDRWLSTRRAREVFTGFIVFVSLGIQYANFAYNPGFHHRHADNAATLRHLHTAQHLYQAVSPVLALLPPGLTARSIAAAHAGHLPAFTAEVLGTLLFAALFFAIFALRLHKEFRGENLSSSANDVRVPKPAASPALAAGASSSTATPHPAAIELPAPSAPLRFSTPPTITAVLHKEFTTMRRTSGIFYAVLAPLIMVVFFVSKMSLRIAPGMLFAAAVAYTLLGICPLSYNSLGMEGAGIQFYFLAPVRMRDVFLAKNLLNFTLGILEVIGVFIAIAISSTAPSPTMAISVLLWAVFTLLINTAVGNVRSITSPKKVDVTKLQNKQTPPLSAFMSMGLLLLSAGIGFLVLFAARYFALPWIVPTAALTLAAIGALVYIRSLDRLDAVLARNRDTLSEVLTKSA